MFKLDNEALFDQSRGLLNQCTQWHFPERIGEEMRWWVCPSPTNERVWFPRHPSYTGFVAFQSCAYLKVVPICALNVLRLGFQHTFSKSNILSLHLWERWSPFGSLTSSSPRLQFVLLFNSYHGKYRQFFWVHINHIIPSISCESVSNFFTCIVYLQTESQIFIDNEWVDSVSGKSFPTVNPATGKIFNMSDVDQIVTWQTNIEILWYYQSKLFGALHSIERSICQERQSARCRRATR